MDRTVCLEQDYNGGDDHDDDHDEEEEEEESNIISFPDNLSWLPISEIRTSPSNQTEVPMVS
jgi:hypothetical protein